MNTELFLQMLQIDSTSGREGELASFLEKRLTTSACIVEKFPVESMAGDCPEGCQPPCNLLFRWGTPKVVFCTHLDTVPPYIAPIVDVSGETGTSFHGRGTCDAKGQIFSMYEACLELERCGHTDFGLLLLAGEETGSFGAKAFNNIFSQNNFEDDCVVNKDSSEAAAGSGISLGEIRKDEKAAGLCVDKVRMPLRAVVEDDWVVIVGEPTDNCMASAAKGTKSFEVEFEGEAFHSGYPQYGRSAVLMFNDFVNSLRSIVFPQDEVLGETTWNIGKLHSDNPQNIISDRLTCRVYFRTTFETDEMVCNVMKNIAGPDAKLRFGKPKAQDGSDIVAKEVADWQRYMKVTAFGGDAPTRFEVLNGFPSKPVSFGSDAPQLKCFSRKILCGPGSILVAHRDNEHILLSDLETAIGNYIEIYKTIVNR